MSEYERATRIMCELEGVDLQEFKATIRHWEARYRHANAVTLQEKTAVVAAEIGCTVEELEAERRELVARTTAIWEAGRP